jgi:glycosyltransferase involved in cell wall biosynthesis
MLSGYIVHSEFDLAAINRRYRLGPLPSKIVRHGPYDHLGDVGPQPRPESMTTGSVVRLLYFGVIRPYKGLEDLAMAIDLLSEEEAATLRLTVAGEVWQGYRTPIDMLQRSRHREVVDLVEGYVTDAELSDLLADCDGLVLPYRRASASGPLHVAMGRGLPVVTTAVGGLNEAVSTYAGAVLVEPNNPTSLKDGLLQVRAKVGTRYSDSYTWGDSVTSILGLLPDAEAPAATDRAQLR